MSIISNGNVVIDSGAIDSNEIDTSQLTDGAVTANKIASTLDLSSKTVTLFSGSIKNMSVVELNSIGTGSSGSSYNTRTDGGVTTNNSSHTFSYGFTATDSSKMAFAIHQINHNNGGHFSKNQYDFRSLSTTGATMVVTDRANSTGVNFRIICVEYA